MAQRNTWQREAVRDALASTEGFVSAQDLHAAIRDKTGIGLATVYRTHPIFVRLRDDDALGGKCGACEYRHVCGGSRARAYGLTGDMMACEPLCSYIPPALRRDGAEGDSAACATS